MKALHLIQRYHPSSPTGSELAMTLVCEALSQTFAKASPQQIVVVTSNVDSGEGFYNPFQKRFPVGPSTIKGVKVIRLGVAWWKGSFFYLLNRLLPWLRPLSGGWLGFQSFGPHLRNLESAILKERPDLIHVAPMPLVHVWQAWRIATKNRIPLVVTPTIHFDDPLFDNPLIYRILGDSQAIIAHTNYEKNQLISHGLPAAKISVIPSSYLDSEDWQPGEPQLIRRQYNLTNQPIALFIGSKSFDKGTIDLLKAWPTVRQQVPGAILIVAGLPTQSWAKGKVGKDMTGVIELDYVSDKLKNNLLAAGNVLCVPSRSESFGMILLEAWAKAKPVIGGSAGATRELVEEGINGYTVAFGDQSELVDKLVQILSNPGLQRRLGQAGRKKAKKFSQKQIVAKTWQTYNKVLKPSG